MPYDDLSDEELEAEIAAMSLELNRRENAVAAAATKAEIDAAIVDKDAPLTKAGAAVETIQDETDGQYVTLKILGVAATDPFEAEYWKERIARLKSDGLALDADADDCVRMRKDRALGFLAEIESTLASIGTR